MGYIRPKAAAKALVCWVSDLSEGQIFQTTDDSFYGPKYGMVTENCGHYTGAMVIYDDGREEFMERMFVLKLPTILQNMIRREVSHFQNVEGKND